MTFGTISWPQKPPNALLLQQLQKEEIVRAIGSGQLTLQPPACARSLTLRADYVKETVAAMGKITHKNDPKFDAAEAEIVRICSTNWVQKCAYESLIKRTQLNEVIIYRLHVRPSFRP
jgi:hypothetical protein